ncbi:MAG: GntR family transcriptional regulator [Gemmatimonadetes bacterium]|nr:GntR family transcriptional regulator [Gemmatimonadota bacterium]
MASVTGTNGRETLASIAYQRLLDDIVGGRLQPGSKLRLQFLTERYAVGNSPLREALNRLSANGMVQREENRGFRVSPASAEELSELIRTRCWLEEIALRESIRHGDAAWEEGVLVAYHRLSKRNRLSDEEYVTFDGTWEDLHRAYHLSLLSACNSKILLDFCAQLHEQTLRYRNLSSMQAYRDRHELDEHRAIRDAVLDRDGDKAVELLRAHYRITGEIALARGNLS